jgi:hypothetical protein
MTTKKIHGAVNLQNVIVLLKPPPKPLGNLITIAY